MSAIPRSSGNGPARSRALFTLQAQRLLADGKAEQAVEICRRGLIYFPENPTGYVLLAQAFLQLGQPERASNVLTDGMHRTGSGSIATLHARLRRTLEARADSTPETEPDVLIEPDDIPEQVETTDAVETVQDDAEPVSDVDVAYPDDLPEQVETTDAVETVQDDAEPVSEVGVAYPDDLPEQVETTDAVETVRDDAEPVSDVDVIAHHDDIPEHVETAGGRRDPGDCAGAVLTPHTAAAAGTPRERKELFGAAEPARNEPRPTLTETVMAHDGDVPEHVGAADPRHACGNCAEAVTDHPAGGDHAAPETTTETVEGWQGVLGTAIEAGIVATDIPQGAEGVPAWITGEGEGNEEHARPTIDTIHAEALDTELHSAAETFAPPRPEIVSEPPHAPEPPLALHQPEPPRERAHAGRRDGGEPAEPRQRAQPLALHTARNAQRLRSSNLRLIPGLEFTPLRHEDPTRRQSIAPLINEPMPQPEVPRRRPKSLDDGSMPPLPNLDTQELAGEAALRLRPSSPGAQHERPQPAQSPIFQPPPSQPDAAVLTPLEDLARRLEQARIPAVEESEQPTAFEPSLISETLANILVAQGAYAEALRAYEALALARPDRSAHYQPLIDDLKRRLNQTS